VLAFAASSPLPLAAAKASASRRMSTCTRTIPGPQLALGYMTGRSVVCAHAVQLQ
jgi:hypothetical protein